VEGVDFLSGFGLAVIALRAASGDGRTGSGLSFFPAGSPKAINAIFFMG